MTEAGPSESTRAASWDEQVFDRLDGSPGSESGVESGSVSAPVPAPGLSSEAPPGEVSESAENPVSGADLTPPESPESSRPVSTRIVIRSRRDSGPVEVLSTSGEGSEASRAEPLFEPRRGAPLSDRVRITGNRSAVRCVICHDDFADDEPVSCPSCGVTLHEDCARELEACPTLGCTVTREGTRRSRRRGRARGQGGGVFHDISTGLASLVRTLLGVVLGMLSGGLATIVLLALAGLLGEILQGTGLSPLIYVVFGLGSPVVFFWIFMKVLLAFVRPMDEER